MSVGSPAAVSNEAPLLTLSDLTIRFGGVDAVSGFSLAVPPGRVTSVIGPNGAGKTTLLNCISGFTRPQSGSIHLHEHDLTKARTWRRADAGVGRTFQNLQLFQRMTVLENVVCGYHVHQHTTVATGLLYWGWAARDDRASRKWAMSVLERVGLEVEANRPAASLPLASQKLLGVARALACRPRLLLLDEPAAGLSQPAMEGLGDLVTRLAQDDGLAIILVEHNMGLVMRVSDHVVVMNQGKLLAQGTPDAMQAHPEVLEVYLGGPVS
ncbi:MAG TPA: ABC transporter ATP-binding protein [Chloroflexota bacterium]|jgi:branched-chain amino acid transport system ATP-binding protein|nr:ABC transporter ATP-binding protein [Chloroflexota bacterium]